MNVGQIIDLETLYDRPLAASTYPENIQQHDSSIAFVLLTHSLLPFEAGQRVSRDSQLRWLPAYYLYRIAVHEQYSSLVSQVQQACYGHVDDARPLSRIPRLFELVHCPLFNLCSSVNSQKSKTTSEHQNC